MRRIVVLLAALFLVMQCSAQMNDAVRTEGGLLKGIAGRDASITVFEGIPYAQPPVGNLRWALPLPVRSWEGIREAGHFSAGCEQVFPKADFPLSEDCLYLNIWTPAKSGGAGLSDGLDPRWRIASRFCVRTYL
jgi:para-nitrobenzyl esterase